MIEAHPVKVFRTEAGREAGIRVLQPSRPGDCGHNIMAPYSFLIWPGTCEKMWTGLDIDIPLETFEAGGMKFGITMTVEGRTSRQLKLVEPGPKEFDSRYRVNPKDKKGIVVGIKNVGILPYRVQKHEEIAQFIFRPYLIASFKEVLDQSEIRRPQGKEERGDGRFGSTDAKRGI